MCTGKICQANTFTFQRIRIFQRLKKKKREKIIEKQFGREISDTVAVAILTELISNPALGSNEFIKHLGKKSINITEVQLKSFLEHHGILKKTRDLPL